MSDGYSAASSYGGYQRSKGDIDYQYSRDSINNAYGRFLSQQRGQRSLGDMSREFGRSLPRYQSTFGARGLNNAGVRSGVERQSMQNYIGDYGRNYLRTQQDVTRDLQQYDYNQEALNEWRGQALADLEARKASEISMAAQNLQALRDLLGSL